MFKFFDKTGQLPHKNLLSVILVLLTFGWIMSFSASLGHFHTYDHFIKQTLFIILGLGLGLIVLKIPLVFYKEHSKLLFIIALVFLSLVFLPEPIGKTVNGSTRWINLVIFNFQPSEMMKIVMILFMAGYLVRQENDIRKPWLGLTKTVLIVSSSGILLLMETDLGAAIIITVTAFAMLLAAGTYLKQLSIIGSILLIATGAFIKLSPVRWNRMTEFWQNDLWLNQSDKVHQTKQALIGIARGDWSGVGLGNGIQKYSKLPEPHTDMIFAVIGEELGIIGMLFVLFVFSYIIFTGFKIAKNALKNGKKYNSYVGFGICTWLSLQFSVNIAMNLGLIPPKGFSLPLLSYGGSSMIFVLLSLAILLRIDMENRSKHKHYV